MRCSRWICELYLYLVLLTSHVVGRKGPRDILGEGARILRRHVWSIGEPLWSPIRVRAFSFAFPSLPSVRGFEVPANGHHRLVDRLVWLRGRTLSADRPVVMTTVGLVTVVCSREVPMRALSV